MLKDTIGSMIECKTNRRRMGELRNINRILRQKGKSKSRMNGKDQMCLEGPAAFDRVLR